MAERTGIVLMPGIDGTGIFFEPLVNALPAHIPLSVVRYPPDAILTLEEHARFVARSFPAGKVVIVAESFSGLVGLSLLHQGHREVQGAVFSAAFAGPLYRSLIDGLSLIPGIEHLLKKVPVSLIDRLLFGHHSKKELKELLVRGIPEIDVKCLKHRAHLIAAGYPFPGERFDTPCLYLKAARDRLVPRKASSWFANHFNSFEQFELDASHCLLQIKPEECSAKIVDFIDRQTSGR